MLPAILPEFVDYSQPLHALERIHALWAKGDARTLEESVELGRLLTELETEMPPGNFYKHVLDVLHIPARAAQQFMQQYRESQGTS